MIAYNLWLFVSISGHGHSYCKPLEVNQIG